MNPRVRDSQRSKLYAAERSVSGFLTDGRHDEMADLIAYVQRVTGSAWFREQFGVGPILVHDGRRHRSAMAYAASFSRGWATIAMPRWSRSEMVVLHEVAHICTPQVLAAHGREYAATYLRLVRHFLGVAKHDALRAAFRAHRVRYLPKRVGVSRGNPEALRRWREAKAASARDGGAVPA